MLIFNEFINPLITGYIPNIGGKLLAAIITLISMAPFMRAIIMKKNRSKEFRNLWNDNKFNQGALISLIILRIALCMLLSLMVLRPLFPEMTVLLAILAFIFLTIITFSQGFKKQSRRIEAHFMENLNRKQKYEESQAAISTKVTNDLLSKDIHIEELEISPQSPSVGKTLQELNFRQTTGVYIITIIRGNKKINIPDGKEYLYPYDTIVVSGSDEEIQKLTQTIKERNDRLSSSAKEESTEHHITISQYLIEKDSNMIGKSIMKLNIREKTECLIIGIDRDENSIINFDSDFIFKENDILWIAGEKEKLMSFDNNIKNTVKKEQDSLS